MELSKEARKKYLKTPTTCPYCSSRKLEADSLDVDGAWGDSSVLCRDCGRRWTDIFKLVDIEIEDPDGYEAEDEEEDEED